MLADEITVAANARDLMTRQLASRAIIKVSLAKLFSMQSAFRTFLATVSGACVSDWSAKGCV